MCVIWTGEEYTTKRTRSAYKIVIVNSFVDSPLNFLSPINPFNRTKQIVNNCGTTLAYFIGRETYSDYPYIYLHKYKKQAIKRVTKVGAFNLLVLKVRIPKGTIVKEGIEEVGEQPTINAAKVVPIKIVYTHPKAISNIRRLT